MDTASKIVGEYRDMERRQWNLMFFNVPESDTEHSAQRKANDMDFVLSLIDDIGASPVNIVDVVRLGARSSDRSRPLRVQFKDLIHKRSVLRNCVNHHLAPSKKYLLTLTSLLKKGRLKES